MGKKKDIPAKRAGETLEAVDAKINFAPLRIHLDCIGIGVKDGGSGERMLSEIDCQN